MKKKCALILGMAVLTLAAAFAWWNGETAFLQSVSSENISAITVRNGNTGNTFEIDKGEDISYIVENIQSVSFRRNGISLFRMGSWFTLSFSDENGDLISEFILNGAQTIRKDPFFYRAETGDMQNMIDYLSAIEERSE